MYRPARRPPGLPTLLLCALGLFLWRLTVIPQLGISLYVDEAQYWTWAQAPDWGYFSKPPGIAGLVWLSTALFGNGILGVKALAMLCYPAAGLVCWAIARRLFDAWTAFWAGLAVLTLPIFSWLGLFVSTDALLTLFWSLALWAYLRALDSDAWGDWLLLGLVCGLGLLSKYTMAAWLGAAFLHLLAFHRPRLASAKPWAAVALALLILSPNIYWNIAHDFPTLKHTAYITLERKSGGGLPSLGEFWGGQWLAFGPVLGSVFLLMLVRAVQSWRDDNTRLLLWFALPLWAVVSAQAIKGGANVNWAAPAFVPTAITAVAWLVQRGKQKWLLAGIAFNVAVVGLVDHWPQLKETVGPQKLAKLNPYKRAQGCDALGRQPQPLLVAHPDAVLVADNRTLLAHLLSDLRPWLGKDAILITQKPLGDQFSTRFAGIEKIATLKAPLDGATSRDMDVYLLHEFKGY